MFMNAPGLKVVASSMPTNTLGLLKAAIRDGHPAVFFEDNDLWPEVGTGVNEGTAPRCMKTEDDEVVEGEPGENISELLG
jgi:pyruvate/2-oxoglutarate/acetoin dehydrogenase E1 component